MRDGLRGGKGGSTGNATEPEKVDTVSADGVKSDGVSFYLASPEQLQSFRNASDALSRWHAPLLAHADNPHERIFMAAFDGTGNDADKDPEHATNVAKISQQVEALTESGVKQIHVEYLAGPGTQDNPLTRTWDLARGHTYEARLETMYSLLVNKADEWKQADPEVQIRVQSIGFSRGASQAAGFTRLLHERGIVDLDSAVERAGIDGKVTVKYTDHLVAPGKTGQVVGLFDPVATGAPMDFDRRLPPSVVSGFQITAADERRAKFLSDRVIPPGLSEDGRFLNVTVAGAHSNNGGGYHRDGLSVRCCNLMVDYLNAGRDTPFLEKYYEPVDPRFAVVHRSEEGMLLYKIDGKVNRLEPGGFNERLQPHVIHEPAVLPHRPDAIDPALLENFQRHRISVRAAPSVPETSLPPLPDAEFTRAARGIGAAEVAKVLRAGGAATVLVDGATTAGRVSDLRQQGNLTGAQSEAMHFAGRNLGMLGGAVLGAQVLGTAGAETGPLDLLIGTAGAVGGAVVGSKVVDAYDQYSIYHQTDAQGITWRLDPNRPEHSWTREVATGAPAPRAAVYGMDALSGQAVRTVTADPALADRLTWQASSKSTELSLAHAPVPRDPYRQSASEHDTRSVGEAAPWVRDAQTHTWSRHVTDQHLEHGLTRSHDETASPSRAAQLDHAAEQTLAANLAQSPQAIAQRYQAVYERSGWQPMGAMPDAVIDALNTPANVLQASDGHTYNLDDEGQWRTPGRVFGTNLAGGPVRQELDATLHAQQAQVAAARSRETPAPNSTTHAASTAAPSAAAEATPTDAFSPSVRTALAQMDRIIEAMDHPDPAVLREAVAPFVHSAEGRAFFAQGKAAVDREDALKPPPTPRDPREAGHPDHTLHQNIREQLRTLHAAEGIYPTRALIEPLTAAVALHARENRLTQVDHLQFNTDKSNIIATQGHHGQINDVFAQHSITAVQQALQTPPAQSYQQMAQVTQQQAQTDQAMQQQMAMQAQQQGPSMGR